MLKSPPLEHQRESNTAVCLSACLSFVVITQVHSFLGLSVGLIQSTMAGPERRQAYSADVTYVTNQELGFDYLRDHLAVSMEGKD